MKKRPFGGVSCHMYRKGPEGRTSVAGTDSVYCHQWPWGDGVRVPVGRGRPVVADAVPTVRKHGTETLCGG